MKTILHVIGARPNFVKAAPAIQALKEIGVRQYVVHTGQHSDDSMSKVFLDELGISVDWDLNLPYCRPWVQVGRMTASLGELMEEIRPALGVVYGDTNSTLAGALALNKCGIPVAHVEAGLRSFDPTMPEEINRIIVDQIADLHFTPSQGANANLHSEGIRHDSIEFVGNLMIDTLVRFLPNLKPLETEPYILVTLHRPSNVDNRDKLSEILEALRGISGVMPIVFPVHPRTKLAMTTVVWFGVDFRAKFLPPLGYSEFLSLQKNAKLVITDSGGVQEETTYLGVPCLTLRPSTERPDTIYMGTNTLVPNVEDLASAAKAVLDTPQRQHSIPPLWDGKAAARFAKVCSDWLKNR